jgi:hypothetical protein
VEGICSGPTLSWLQSDSFENLLPLGIDRRSFYLDLNRLRSLKDRYVAQADAERTNGQIM